MFMVLTLHNESRTKCERVWSANRHGLPAKELVLITSATSSAPRRSVSYSLFTECSGEFGEVCRACGFRAPSARNNHIVVKQLTIAVHYSCQFLCGACCNGNHSAKESAAGICNDFVVNSLNYSCNRYILRTALNRSKMLLRICYITK